MISSSLVFLSILAGTLALPSTSGGTAIPISRRSSTKNPDGTVNIEKLRKGIDASIAKFQRGFDAYEKNIGVPHRLAGKTGAALSKRATGSVPLTDFEEDLWFGDITVGTPGVTFTVDFDTGSSDTFLPAVNCDSSCSGHTLWNPAKSSTAVPTNQSFQLAFGDGSTVNTTVVFDTVKVGGLTATGQAIGASSHYSPGFETSQFPPDGLSGLGFPALSVFGQNDLFTTLVNEGQTTAAEFGVKLADSGSELFLGGVNTNLFTGSFTNSPVVEDAFWEIALQGFGVNGKVLGTGSIASIVDTGTTLIIGDSTDVSAFYAQVKGAKSAPQLGAGIFTVPCNGIPTLELEFAGKFFTVSPTTFNAGSVGNNACVGGLVAEDLGFWVIGDVFLRNVYTSFNKGGNQVGFATLK